MSPPSSPGFHAFMLRSASGNVVIGDWWPPGPKPEAGTLHVTSDPATAERWRAALAEGRLPDPEPCPAA